MYFCVPVLAEFSLENKLESELNLPLRNSRSHQHTRQATVSECGIQRYTSGIEDVSVAVAWSWRSEIRMIKNIEHLDPQLSIEIFGDSPDMVVFENREVQAGNAWSNQDVASGIAPEIETLWKTEAVVLPKGGRVGRCGYGKALRLDVVLGVAGIAKGVAPWSAKPVRVGKIVAAQSIRGIPTGSPRCSKGHAVTERENGAKFPAICDPPHWP